MRHGFMCWALAILGFSTPIVGKSLPLELGVTTSWTQVTYSPSQSSRRAYTGLLAGMTRPLNTYLTIFYGVDFSYGWPLPATPSVLGVKETDLGSHIHVGFFSNTEFRWWIETAFGVLRRTVSVVADGAGRSHSNAISNVELLKSFQSQIGWNFTLPWQISCQPYFGLTGIESDSRSRWHYGIRYIYSLD